MIKDLISAIENVKLCSEDKSNPNAVYKIPFNTAKDLYDYLKKRKKLKDKIIALIVCSPENVIERTLDGKFIFAPTEKILKAMQDQDNESLWGDV